MTLNVQLEEEKKKSNEFQQKIQQLYNQFGNDENNKAQFDAIFNQPS